MYEEQPLVAVRIKDGIFCGNVTAAYDEDFLIMNKVTHIVNCSGGETRDLYKSSGIQYLNFPWSQPQNPTSGPILFDQSDKNIETIIRFVDEALAQGECVLVQSVHGRSRSCAIVAAYFIIKYRWTLDHALDFIAMAHEDMEIHPLFRKQLAQFYQKHEIPASQTGRALDVFHPEIDEGVFALDNEQWMLRNTYVNGLVNETQERTDLYKVATSRVTLAEPNPKAAAKRRRRITFCDTKQGTSVACMWTQPIVQPRNPTPVITPPPSNEISGSIVARPGTPNSHRLEGEATANVHTATPITAVGYPNDPHRANTIKLQLRSNVLSNLAQNRQQQQQQNQGESNSTSNTLASGLTLQRDSPMIGRGPALVATASVQNNNQDSNNNRDNHQYNQTVSRIVPQDYNRNDSNNSGSDYGDNNHNNNGRQNNNMASKDSNVPNAFSSNQNNNNNSRNNNSSNQAPTAANIAASLGTTGQGSLITLRGGAPLSVVSASGGGNNNNNSSSSTTTGDSSSRQQPHTTLFNRNNNDNSSSTQQMRPIPDANTGIRNLGGSSSLNSNNNNSTTPSRPGPTLRGHSNVQPGHNRNNPFTLPASGRTTHRGSPLPMQRAGGGGVGGNSRLTSSSSQQPSAASQRTNSPIRNNIGSTSAPFGSSSGLGARSQYTNSPLKSNNTIGGNSSIGNISPRTNSPMAINRGGSPIRNNTIGGGTSSSANLTSFSNYHTQQRLNAGGTTSSSGNLRGSSPSSVGNRPSSPSRPNAPTSSSGNNNNLTSSTGRSMLGGQTTSSQWSSSLLPSNNSSAGATGNRPRTGSPLVRSNSPGNQLRTGNNIPSANSTMTSLQNPPSRPASISQQLSSHPSSHIPRQSNSPLAAGRRTGSPIRSAAATGGQSSFLSSNNNNNSGPSLRTNSPLAANRGSAGGGTLAEQFLYRSSANTTSGQQQQQQPSSSFRSSTGRNSPMMRR